VCPRIGGSPQRVTTSLKVPHRGNEPEERKRHDFRKHGNGLTTIRLHSALPRGLYRRGRKAVPDCCIAEARTGQAGGLVCCPSTVLDNGYRIHWFSSPSVNEQVKHFDTDEHCDRCLHGDVPGLLALFPVVLLGQSGEQ